MELTRFETHPSKYKHWKLAVDGEVATLVMAVDDEHPHKPGYELKLNSYDLSVDIELADAIQRLRFEHPAVKSLVITADLDRVFCSGANIYMLGMSSHSFKVNFCKFTNETRLYLEDAAANSGLGTLCACKGTTAGGGYELALACDEIMLVDDGNSAVSFPETPLLAVLPGTGGLTRLVDKRKVRRDRADVFCTTAEGIKGKRAKDWGLVDHVVSRSAWDKTVGDRAKALAGKQTVKRGPAIELPALSPKLDGTTLRYRYVELKIDNARRVGELTVRGPDGAPDLAKPDTWSLQAFRELDDALLHLRFDFPDIGMITVRTVGDVAQVVAHDEALAAATTGFAREIRLLQRRVLKRFDNTARSFYAVADRADSCFAGSLLELALGADRFYMLIDGDEAIGVATSSANAGFMTMSSGLSRLQARFYGEPERVDAVLGRGKGERIPSEEAEKLGIATIAADDIDFEDELRIAIEERASLSPDALTGMEQSLRFVGPETLETKIFGRLSAWQNWIFTRANSTGEHGALTLYGQPERPQFQWKRT
ncbi:MAG TPA: 2,3-epoxybenzoyl-CoA dihydrolase [Kofleriaceae bacterium]|nr:2,3-epoxybenzoyl-CoA dihydrolase [Kofleriaceae bacterium]